MELSEQGKENKELGWRGRKSWIPQDLVLHGKGWDFIPRVMSRRMR